ncbi:putative pentatricopeptide repeat-containing protein At1g17630 [Dendrobium catenatum]|uniref:Pentatricopeptide repeat-containing protein n=1 Tax=Dendrobium catenatum TaxID=906689 RepID=A0A2I0WPL9_9ASPA|nr:putative pentatricopeptide repeat-containing protein At1g17630 [Dendrobium catenatum]PKU77607.1 Putative pentatricopeptide repeat-containing protein [Dendrobium catenatum]
MFLASSSLDLLLHRCATPRQAQQIHALILLTGHHNHSPFLSARLISLYSHLNLLPAAISLFLSAPSPSSSILCNSILRSLLCHSQPFQAICLYRRARSLNAIPDGFTFPLAIRACTSLTDSSLCVAVHAQAVTMGFGNHLHVANELVLLYGHRGQMDLARKVFDGMRVRTVVTWNILVSGYSQNREWDNARKVFDVMRRSGPTPNSVTWTSLLSAYAQCQCYNEVADVFDEMRECGCEATAEAVAVALSVCPYVGSNGGRDGLEKGKEIHGFVERSGFEGFSFVRNSLVCMYGKLGNSGDAEKLFSEMEMRDLVSWNALISSYAASGCCDEAYEVFCRLQEAGEPKPSVVSWSAVIGGFASCGAVEKSVELFRLMQRAGVKYNAVTLATVLSACAELSSFGSGREIHAHTIRNLMDGNILIQNGLLNLYTKSGGLNYGCLVFDRIKGKDLITWNSMINGHGLHGSCDKALSTFRSMVACGLEPDGITFVAVLSACSHAGRVTEGRKVFDLMVHQHGISPGLEHYSCMVDLLGRAGLIREASELVENMPMRPNACVWGALLSSCRIHGNAAMAEDTASRILGLEEETSGIRMLISNIYAATGRWEDSARVRVMTREKGIRKNPGQSWIEVNKTVLVFSAGGSLPPGAEGAYDVLEDLNMQMETENQVASDWFLLDWADEEA